MIIEKFIFDLDWDFQRFNTYETSCRYEVESSNVDPLHNLILFLAACRLRGLSSGTPAGGRCESIILYSKR
jgi:hypothetical protein